MITWLIGLSRLILVIRLVQVKPKWDTYSTIQEMCGSWLLHCGDSMLFIGADEINDRPIHHLMPAFQVAWCSLSPVNLEVPPTPHPLAVPPSALGFLFYYYFFFPSFFCDFVSLYSFHLVSSRVFYFNFTSERTFLRNRERGLGVGGVEDVLFVVNNLT